MIVTTDYILPMFKSTPQGLWCGCDMCFSEETHQPVSNIGPHDLHCLCPPCMSFCLNERAYDESLEIRYPGYETFCPEPLTQQQIDQLWAESDSIFYEPAPTSPTNSDMHAYNGNLSHQHHHGNGDFIRAAGTHLSALADRHRYPLMMGQAGLLPAGMLYSSFQNMSKPLSELREQIFGKSGPTNKDMHSYNGNRFNLFPGDSTNSRPPKIDHKKAPNRDTGLHEAHQDKPHDNYIIPFEEVKIPKDHVEVPDPYLDALKHAHDVGYPSPYPDPEMGPTNQEMHATNGNVYYGPKTEKQHKRAVKKKIRKKEHKKFKKMISKGRAPFPLPRPKVKLPKGVKAAAKIETEEKRIAARYSRFLKYPALPPPRLGSTGNMPTKLVHGYYKSTFSMAAPSFGVNTITNATEFVGFLCPKIVGTFANPSAYFSPIGLGFSNSSSVAFFSNAGAGGNSNTFGCPNFLNSTALWNEVGTNADTITPNPMARWLGAAISVECRCPMSTTAPPYLFGGLLPADYSANIGPVSVSTSNQLNQLTTTQIRALPSTQEVQGYEISAVYIPDTPNALQFDPYTANGNTSGTLSTGMISSAIPYIGMSGCPTTATITVYVTSWFEIQQTPNNANYASGWRIGPKVSSEDVYDNLKRISPVSNRIVNIGAKQASFSLSSFLMSCRKPPEEIPLSVKLANLCDEVKQLKLQIEDEEEEKYVTTSPPDTPKHNLSQSTINLALALKDRLNPGSVTSKTSKTSQL
jgi:hypothetical protein